MKLPANLKTAVLTCAIASGLAAQTKPQNTPDAALARRQSIPDAVAFCAAGDFAGAEHRLVLASRRPAETAQWHVETAAKLTQLALVIAGTGDARAVNELTIRALEHLSEVEAAAEAGTLSNAQELAGFIYERLVGDAKSALRCYRAAVQLSPTATGAAEGLDRLSRQESVGSQKNPNRG